MHRLTEVQMAKKDTIKIARTGIRLRKSIEGDHECNDVLPDLEERIDQAIVSGERLQISAGSLFNAAFEGVHIDSDS
jgi:hypothetical protein